jgi:hypothetical protein
MMSGVSQTAPQRPNKRSRTGDSSRRSNRQISSGGSSKRSKTAESSRRDDQRESDLSEADMVLLRSIQAELADDDDSDGIIDMTDSAIEPILLSDDEELEALEETVPTNIQARKGFLSVKCCVCLDPPEVLAVTPCGHVYCGDCVLRALSSASKATTTVGECSICRRKVSYKSVTFLEMLVRDEAKDSHGD